MYKDGRSTALKNLVNIILGDFSLTFHDNLITLDGNHFTGILINEVLVPAFQHTGSQIATNHLLHVLLVHLHFLSEVENLKDILVSFKTDGTQKRGYGQLLLTIDVSIHHIVDVSCKLNPRTLERNNTCRIEHGSVGMNTLTEEHTG